MMWCHSTMNVQDALVAELRKKFQGCTPRINYIAAVDSRCIRVEYSTASKLRWIEIWATLEPGVFSILRPEKIRSPEVMNKSMFLSFMNTKFALPEKK
jgi:hypothetical protein